MLDHVHGEASLARLVQRGDERQRQHGPAGQEQKRARRLGCAPGEPIPADGIDQQRERERHDQDRVELPAQAVLLMMVHGHAQHPGSPARR